MTTRDTKKAKNATTSICLEQPVKNNPYLTEKLYLSGYDIEALANKVNYVDILFLLFTGELPGSEQDRKLLETLMIQMAMPSPRHPSAKAAMNAGVCKSNAEHLLPISLLTLGGARSGAVEVENCYLFIEEHITSEIKPLTQLLLNQWNGEQQHIAPGFGQLFGNIDPLTQSFLNKLVSIKPHGKTLQWISEFVGELNRHQVGVLDVGLVACVFHELSLGARESVGLYQLLRAPGLLAYAMEQTHKPVSAIPMLDDSQYNLTK